MRTVNLVKACCCATVALAGFGGAADASTFVDTRVLSRQGWSADQWAVTNGTGPSTTAIWTERRRHRQHRDRVVLRSADLDIAATAFSAPVTVLRDARGIRSGWTAGLSVAASDSGEVVAAWTRRARQRWVIESITRPAGARAWSEVTRVAVMRRQPVALEVAAASASESLVYFETHAERAWAALRRASAWQMPQRLPADGRAGSFPSPAIAASPDAGFAVVLSDDAGVELVRALPGQDFGPPVRLTTAKYASRTDVSLTRGGLAIAAWSEGIAGDRLDREILRAVTVTRDGQVTPFFATSADDDAIGTTVASNASGESVVVWDHSRYRRRGVGVVQRRSSGQVLPAQDIANIPIDEFADAPRAGVAGNGTAAMAWQGQCGSGATRLFVTIRPAGGAAFERVSVITPYFTVLAGLAVRDTGAVVVLAQSGQRGPVLLYATYAGDPTPQLRLRNVCTAPVLE